MARSLVVASSPWCQSPAAHLRVDVLPHHRMQVLPASLVPDLPNVLQGGDDVGEVVSGTAALLRYARIPRLHFPEALNRSLSREAGDLHHGIEDLTLAPLVRTPILPLLLFEYALLCHHVHMATRYPNYYLLERVSVPFIFSYNGVLFCCLHTDILLISVALSI